MRGEGAFRYIGTSDNAAIGTAYKASDGGAREYIRTDATGTWRGS